jgi:ketosteroid isomerase-like protein
MVQEYRKAYSPQEAHEIWVEYGRAKDLEGMLSLYEPNACIYDVSKGKLMNEPDERRAYLKEFIETVEDFHLHTASVTISGDGSVALLRSKWYAKGVTGKDAEERSEWTVENCGAEVVRKQPDGSWLVIIDNPYAATSWDSYPEY